MASSSTYSYSDDIRHLNIPPISSGTGPNAYAICSLWSTIEYFANCFPNNEVRRSTKRMALQDIGTTFSLDRGGWRPKQHVLTELSKQVESISFSSEKWPGNPPKDLIDLAFQYFEKDIPLVAFVDGVKIRGLPGEGGPIYTVVIAGLDQTRAVIVDPWDGDKKVVKNQKLQNAWDPELHQVIQISLGLSQGKMGKSQ